jgi:hypothetical protein
MVVRCLSLTFVEPLGARTHTEREREREREMYHIRLLLAADTLELIIECNLLAVADISRCKDPYAQLSLHRPFLRDSIWIARVVDEACEIALARCINTLVAIESQHVKVCFSFLGLFKSLVSHNDRSIKHELANRSIGV